MKPALRLKICNITLGCLLVIMLASGIQLEATSGRYIGAVWIHIVLGILLCVLSCCHIYLHYRLSNWFTRFAKNRNKSTRVLWWTFLLTTVSGLTATVIWLDGNVHSHLGAVHGKIGFFMIIVAILHHIKHNRKRS